MSEVIVKNLIDKTFLNEEKLQHKVTYQGPGKINKKNLHLNKQ